MGVKLMFEVDLLLICLAGGEVEFAWDLGFRRVEVEIDSNIAVDMILSRRAGANVVAHGSLVHVIQSKVAVGMILNRRAGRVAHGILVHAIQDFIDGLLCHTSGVERLQSASGKLCALVVADGSGSAGAQSILLCVGLNPILLSKEKGTVSHLLDEP
ncbi:hypothetical protein Ancab_036147 [Ancistrocladus abbreviatus]